MSNYIVIFGPPGVGKGTQCQRLAKRLQVPHISTGDIFRENLRKQGPQSQQVKHYMEAGKLVPDEIVVDIVRERLVQPDARDGYLLDGFPRTLAQAEHLAKVLSEMGMALSAVVNLQATDEVVVERISGRRVCKKCRKIYHITYNPPQQEGVCDVDGGELYQRDDDRPEAVERRLVEYHQQTEPVLRYYQELGLIENVEGTQSVEAVTDAIMSRLATRRGEHV